MGCAYTIWQYGQIIIIIIIIINDNYIFSIDQPIALVGRVFANGPGDRGSIPGRVIPKT